MLLDIELCHVYLRDFLASRQLAKDDIDSIRRGQRRAEAFISMDGANRVRFSVMVDDEEGELSDEDHLDEIRELLAKHGISPDLLIYESWLSRFADELINNLRPNVVTKDQDCVFLNVATDDRLLWAEENLREMKSIKRIFLENVFNPEQDANTEEQDWDRSRFWVPLKIRNGEKTSYSCSTLTAVWYLHRLGVAGFVEQAIERPDELLNILPLKYLKTEGIAIDILNLSSATRIRKARKKIDYIFL